VLGGERVAVGDQVAGGVTVTGTFQPGGHELPELAAGNVVGVAPPDDPYE
jgi:hypothetical protein